MSTVFIMPEGKVISFRLPDNAVELLKQQKQPRESLNQVAQRMVLNQLGLYETSEAVTDNQLSTLSTEIEQQLHSHLEPVIEKINELENQLKKL
jgi:regulator of protease activity HflC (stomatin/prohibitin superfamily)